MTKTKSPRSLISAKYLCTPDCLYCKGENWVEQTEQKIDYRGIEVEAPVMVPCPALVARARVRRDRRELPKYLQEA